MRHEHCVNMKRKSTCTGPGWGRCSFPNFPDSGQHAYDVVATTNISLRPLFSFDLLAAPPKPSTQPDQTEKQVSL